MTAVAFLVASFSFSGVASAVPSLQLPFPCGESYQVTQDHNGGSHTGKGAWAWDFGIGVGGVVTAPADGIVRMVKMDSTRHGCSSAYASDANYVVLDFGDGTEALFLHLKANSSRVSVGDQVRQGDPVAEVGNSGWICGTHLHFQIQQTCSSWWCQSVQASFQGAGDPLYPTTVTSNNCQQPPPVCTVPSGSERVIDEQEDCFRQQTTYWWDESGGWDNHWFYTYAINGAADTVGSWHFDVEASNTYELHVHIPAGAESKQAKYLLETPSGDRGPFQVDQTAHNGWVKIGGQFDFDPGNEYAIRLPDNTGESYDDRVKLAFDAVRVRPYDPPDPDPDTGPSDTGPADTGPADTGTADTGVADTGAVDTGLPDVEDEDTMSQNQDTGGQPDTGSGLDSGQMGADAVQSDAGDSGAEGRHISSTGGCTVAGGGSDDPAGVILFILGLGAYGLTRRRR